MKVKFDIPLSYNPVPDKELLTVLNAYKDRHHDEMIVDFEKKLSEITGSFHAVALNSGTAAIHLGLKALGVGAGDVVIASTFTYVASINPILYLGASPFFVDSGADDWNMDAELLEQAILQSIKSGNKPKVILVVHTYGMPAKMKAIMALSKQYEIPVLEDAAEALGSTYEGQQVGTFGAVGIISFNNNKLITTYGGGVLVTNDPLIAQRVNLWASHSRDNQPYYEHREIGYSYRIGPLNAAMGLAQMGSIKNRIANRRAIHDFYKKNLAGKLKWQEEGSDTFSNRWLTAVELNGNKNEIQQRLLGKKIEVRPLWKPMHLQPVFSSFDSFANGHAEKLFVSGLCLPSGELDAAEQLEVIRQING